MSMAPQRAGLSWPALQSTSVQGVVAVLDLPEGGSMPHWHFIRRRIRVWPTEADRQELLKKAQARSGHGGQNERFVQSAQTKDPGANALKISLHNLRDP